IDDSVRDGGDAKVIASLDRQRVNSIRGPITIDGGIRVAEDRFLDNPIMLPGENNFPLADGATTGATVVSGQAPISDTHATYVDPVRGVMPGFDPRINDFSFGFSVFDLATH